MTDKDCRITNPENASVHTAKTAFWKPISECPKEDRKMYFIMMPDGFAFSGWFNRETKKWEGDAECYKKYRFAYYAEVPPLEAE
ncbi:hypothetical protein [uncultured Bartonella sp.]|uniref:hypothetical protein n=1 Tax=uncultured Bartonella sp. TaxID=104108 RepID=UPI0025F75CB3|nr:hypothetical protein [uncultured Bartonella sp.]